MTVPFSKTGVGWQFPSATTAADDWCGRGGEEPWLQKEKITKKERVLGGKRRDHVVHPRGEERDHIFTFITILVRSGLS